VATLTWQAETASSGAAGRAISRIRSNNFLVDDYAMPPYNGPGEEPGAAELFLSGVTTCAVLMLERIARSEGLPLHNVHAGMEASRDTDSERQPPTFDNARLSLTFAGLTPEQAGCLVEQFKRR
jgi:uncharacterized OsmC-like protein